MHLMIVEDQALVREGFRMILESMGRFDHTVECGSLAAALVSAAHLGDALGLAILDLGLPDAKGLDGLERLLGACPGVPVIVVSGGVDTVTIHAAFARGARGYVPKNASGPAFRAAVEAVLRGELSVPPEVLAVQSSSRPPAGALAMPLSAPASPADSARLTPRQEEVLFLIAKGLPNKDIAKELDMSPATVRVHVTAVLKALEVENRTQAAVSASARHLAARRATRT